MNLWDMDWFESNFWDIRFKIMGIEGIRICNQIDLREK